MLEREIPTGHYEDPQPTAWNRIVEILGSHVGSDSEARPEVPSAAPATEASKDRIGVFLLGNGTLYQRLLAQDAKDAAARLGVPVTVVESDNFAAQQSQDIMRFLHTHAQERLGVIVMTVSDTGSLGGAAPREHPVYKLARRVLGKSCAWIVLNRDAEDQIHVLRAEFPKIPIGLVTPDQKEVGRIQGRQFRALLPRGGRVLYVLGNPYVSSSEDRRAGMREAIAGAGFQLDEVDGLWSADKARDVVLKRLLSSGRERDKQPDIIGCQNDEMARGVLEALDLAASELRSPALRSTPVTGVDGIEGAGRQWVDEKRLVATVMIPVTSGRAVELLRGAWTSKATLPSKTVVPAVSYPALDKIQAITRVARPKDAA
jgi:ABC-type sugar transport system substrate-binding protein